MDYIPIDKEYFLNLKFPNRICEKKAVCLDPEYFWEHRGQWEGHHKYKLKNVFQVVEYFKNEEYMNSAISKLASYNWEYFNCLRFGFRRKVLDTDAHKKHGGPEISLEERNNTLSPEYYESLEKMTDDEILEFNKDNPIDFDPGWIRHGTHRAYAMIGRLIRGESYIPFYIHKDKFLSPTDKVNFIYEMDKLGVPRNEYTICQSSLLSVMDIRENEDLDIVVSSKLRDYSLGGDVSSCKIHDKIEVFSKNAGKFKAFGCRDDDDLIKNFSININGYNFCEPRFYFSRIWPENEKKIKDQNDIKRFFQDKRHEFYPFNEISIEKWGFDLLPKKA